MNCAGKIAQPLLLIVPGLLAIGILLMFFMGRTGIHSQDLLYEDLESRIKRLEQRLARLEQVDRKNSLPDEKRKEWQSQQEKQSRPESQSRPEAPEKQEGGAFHQVGEGDTLFKIGRLHNVTVEDLRRWNNLSPGEGIRTGQKLRISESSGK